MDQESHRQDPEEFYVKQDRIGSPVFTLLDRSLKAKPLMLQGKAHLERSTKGGTTSLSLIILFMPPYVI